MKRRFPAVWMLASMVITTAAVGQANEQAIQPAPEPARSAAGWIERAQMRLERAVERLEMKLTGRGDSGMPGCQDMMGGGGMTGDAMMGGGMSRGSRPNERWRNAPETR